MRPYSPAGCFRAKLYFLNSVPCSDMEISEHRLDSIFAQKPISQQIDDGMKPNWGTGSQNLEKNLKIILSRFQILKLKFPGQSTIIVGTRQ